MNNSIIEKKEYSSPQIIRVKLDNEISLALESDPPTYESTNNVVAPEYFNNNPFKDNLG
jgi:hypothetical protein